MSYTIPLSDYCIKSLLSGVEVFAKSFLDESISLIGEKGETATLEVELEELIRRAFSPCFVSISIGKTVFVQTLYFFEITIKFLDDGETHTIKNG